MKVRKLSLSTEWENRASGGTRQDRNKSILLNTRYNWKLVFIHNPQNTEGKGFLTPLSGTGNRKMDKETCLSHTRVSSFPKLVFIKKKKSQYSCCKKRDGIWVALTETLMLGAGRGHKRTEHCAPSGCVCSGPQSVRKIRKGHMSEHKAWKRTQWRSQQA